jgi:hypothetical protein
MKIWMMALSLALAGTADAAWKMKVTKGGQTTTTGDSETMEKHEQDEKAKAEHQKAIAAAPRRAATDPISVVIVAEGKTDENLERANKMLADELKKDPLLKVSLAKARSGGEVYVVPFLGTEAALGRKANGKMAVGNAIVYKADVTSAYEPGARNAKELGNLMQTGQMVKSLAVNIAKIVKTEIGPKLPSAAAVAEINKKHMKSSVMSQTGIEAGDDAKTMMKKLFKPRNKAN